ncbi:replication termination factor 2, partial [Lecanoromycetidae sp. Uapishka_2]
MGNDGGSIPTRRELVKEGARDLTTTQVKEIQTEQQEHYWTTCALSHQPLSLPVVSDALGTLYNKDAVLDRLLNAGQEDKTELEARKEAFKDRLRSLRDVVECSEKYTTTDIIPILPTSQTEKDRLEERIQTLKETGLTHSLKKAPNSSKKKRKAATVEEAPALVEVSKVPEQTTSKAESNIKNQETASLTAKVLAEQEERNKRRKTGANDNVKSLFSSRNGMDEKHIDFMTRGYTIPANAKR